MEIRIGTKTNNTAENTKFLEIILIDRLKFGNQIIKSFLQICFFLHFLISLSLLLAFSSNTPVIQYNIRTHMYICMYTNINVCIAYVRVCERSFEDREQLASGPLVR